MLTKAKLATIKDDGYKTVVSENDVKAAIPKINFIPDRRYVQVFSVSGWKYAFLKVGANATASIIVIIITDHKGFPVRYQTGIVTSDTTKNIQSLLTIYERELAPKPTITKTKLINAVIPVTQAPGPPPSTVWATKAIAVKSPQTNHVNAWGLTSPLIIPLI